MQAKDEKVIEFCKTWKRLLRENGWTFEGHLIVKKYEVESFEGRRNGSLSPKMQTDLEKLSAAHWSNSNEFEKMEGYLYLARESKDPCVRIQAYYLVAEELFRKGVTDSTVVEFTHQLFQESFKLYKEQPEFYQKLLAEGQKLFKSNYWSTQLEWAEYLTRLSVSNKSAEAKAPKKEEKNNQENKAVDYWVDVLLANPDANASTASILTFIRHAIDQNDVDAQQCMLNNRLLRKKFTLGKEPFLPLPVMKLELEMLDKRTGRLRIINGWIKLASDLTASKGFVGGIETQKYFVIAIDKAVEQLQILKVELSPEERSKIEQNIASLLCAAAQHVIKHDAKHSADPNIKKWLIEVLKKNENHAEVNLLLGDIYAREYGASEDKLVPINQAIACYEKCLKSENKADIQLKKEACYGLAEANFALAENKESANQSRLVSANHYCAFLELTFFHHDRLPKERLEEIKSKLTKLETIVDDAPTKDRIQKVLVLCEEYERELACRNIAAAFTKMVRTSDQFSMKQVTEDYRKAKSENFDKELDAQYFWLQEAIEQKWDHKKGMIAGLLGKVSSVAKLDVNPEYSALELCFFAKILVEQYGHYLDDQVKVDQQINREFAQYCNIFSKKSDPAANLLAAFMQKIYNEDKKTLDVKTIEQLLSKMGQERSAAFILKLKVLGDKPFFRLSISLEDQEVFNQNLNAIQTGFNKKFPLKSDAKKAKEGHLQGDGGGVVAYTSMNGNGQAPEDKVGRPKSSPVKSDWLPKEFMSGAGEQKAEVNEEEQKKGRPPEDASSSLKTGISGSGGAEGIVPILDRFRLPLSPVPGVVSENPEVSQASGMQQPST